jgi:hypothetical protein
MYYFPPPILDLGIMEQENGLGVIQIVNIEGNQRNQIKP